MIYSRCMDYTHSAYQTLLNLDQTSIWLSLWKLLEETFSNLFKPILKELMNSQFSIKNFYQPYRTSLKIINKMIIMLEIQKYFTYLQLCWRKWVNRSQASYSKFSLVSVSQLWIWLKTISSLIQSSENHASLLLRIS